MNYHLNIIIDNSIHKPGLRSQTMLTNGYTFIYTWNPHQVREHNHHLIWKINQPKSKIDLI